MGFKLDRVDEVRQCCLRRDARTLSSCGASALEEKKKTETYCTRACVDHIERLRWNARDARPATRRFKEALFCSVVLRAAESSV